MPILNSEHGYFHAYGKNDTSSGGGWINKNDPITSGLKRNFLPEPTPAQMTAGATWQRKLFPSFQSASNAGGQDTLAWLDRPSPGDDQLFFYPGTQRNIKSDLTGSEDRFGSGTLDSGVSISDTEIDVVVEDAAVILFRDTELLVLDDGVNQQFVAIDGTPSILSNVVTITLAEALEYNFAINTPVSSVYEAGDVASSVDNKSITTAGSLTLDEAQITMESIGVTEADVTVTLTSASNFTVSALIGSPSDPIDLGSGNVSTDFTATHPDTGEDMFVIPSAAWGGTGVTADEVDFQVHPCAFGLWFDRIVPAGAGSLAANDVTLNVKTFSS